MDAFPKLTSMPWANIYLPSAQSRIEFPFEEHFSQKTVSQRYNEDYDTVAIPSKIRTEILSMLREDAAPPSMLSQMDAEMGHTFANAIHIFAHKHGISVDDIDLIGSGGWLITLSGAPLRGQHRSNMCLGEGAVISAKTGVTTVSDYRTAEQAVGIQGAPLFAYVVGLLLHHPTRLQICITIVGHTTVCFIPSDKMGGVDALYNWDTGPGTCMIDAAYRQFRLDPQADQSSLLHGTICHEVVEQLLANDKYLSTRPPKTRAMEIYGDSMAYKIMGMCAYRGCSSADTISTVTRFTSASIAQHLLLYGPGRDAINSADIIVDSRVCPTLPLYQTFKLNSQEPILAALMKRESHQMRKKQWVSQCKL